MTELLAVPTVVASITALVPLVGAVFQIYVDHPIRVESKHNILETFKTIRKLGIVKMLEPGTYDVTPADATNNYTMAVMGNTKEDATGILQISDSYKGNFQITRSSRAGQVTTTDSDGSAIELNHNNVVIIAEEAPDDRGKLDMWGFLIHRPPGVPAFPENK